MEYKSANWQELLANLEYIAARWNNPRLRDESIAAIAHAPRVAHIRISASDMRLEIRRAWERVEIQEVFWSSGNRKPELMPTEKHEVVRLVKPRTWKRYVRFVDYAMRRHLANMGLCAPQSHFFVWKVSMVRDWLAAIDT